jgi:two-component system phosphate regulon sensor histidine kinase PhoR
LASAQTAAGIAFSALGLLAASIGWPLVAFACALCAGFCFARQPVELESPPPPPLEPPSPWERAALDGVLAALADGVVVLDASDRALCANAGARSLLGLRLTGQDAPSLMEQVDWPQLEAALFEARRSRVAQVFEAARSAGDQGQLVAVAVSVPGKDGGVVIVLRDQSRLRQLESLRRDFVANVSHELKTPLAAIQGFVETMIDDPDMPDGTRARFLERMHRQVQRLATLVTDLLTLSRLDEGAAEHGEPCDVTSVAREVVRDLMSFAEQRGVSLRIDVPAHPIWIAAEREALRQVVSNLTDNAIKYTPRSGSVAARLVVDGEHAQFMVVDTGIGLAEEDQERVFERFYRVDKARSRELGGTGLGLSIVKNTVQGLGGSVGVSSRLGYGSTFWARLPIAKR